MCNLCNTNNSAKDASVFTTDYFDNVVAVDLKNAKSSLDSQKEYAKKGLLVESVLNLKDTSGKTIFDAASYKKFLGEGKKRPDTIHPMLWEHANLNMNVGLYRVNNLDNMFTVAIGDVFQIRGYDIANMTLLLGATGWIIMDVLTTSETAAAAMKFVEAHLGKLDVVAVIYSHSHVDHYGGVGGVLQGAANVEIIAPENFLVSAVSENVYAGNAMNSRAVFMYGSMLEHSAKGQIDAGLGKATAVGTRSLMPPTVEIKYCDADRARGYCEMTVDGLSLQFQLTPGTEAPAEMNVYVPSNRVLFIAENCCGTLHNLYTLRGAEVRDPLAWADYLDETIKVFHDVQTICSSHNWPQFSERDNSACIDYLKKQRDVYRYLGNTTLNLINKGYTIEEIGRKLDTLIPAPLMAEWRNHGFYGTVNHNAKAIYQKYIGWYDGNPSNLNKLAPIHAATQYVEAMGGGGIVLARAHDAYQSGNYAWAAELLNRLIFARVRECDAAIKNQAKLLNADVLEQLGYQSESGPWRNEYLTAAMVLRAEAFGNGQQPAKTFELENSIVNAMSPEMLMQYMSIMFDGYAASTKGLTLSGCVIFTDGAIDPVDKAKHLPVSISYEVNGGVLTCLPYENGSSAGTDGFSGTKMQFYKAIMGRPEAVITTSFKELCAYIKPFTMGFSIVSPAVTGEADRQASNLGMQIPQEKRIKIFRAAQMVERYEKKVVALGEDYYNTTISLSDQDKLTWKALRPEIVKLSNSSGNPVDDTLFFKAPNVALNDDWGIGADGFFKKAEYTHFLYECYRSLYIDAPKQSGLLCDCILMLTPLVEHFRGYAPTAPRHETLSSDRMKRWNEEFYPILVELNVIADDTFSFPAPNGNQKFGIGTDGIYDLTDLCNVLMRCLKLAMIDELRLISKAVSS